MAKDKNYKHYRILDFNPDICDVEDGYIVLFSPYKLIVDGVLVIPDGKTDSSVTQDSIQNSRRHMNNKSYP